MGRKRHTPEQIIRKLREAEVALAKGQAMAEVARKLGVTEQTYYLYGLLPLCNRISGVGPD
jgi:transposase-like protein